MSDQPTLSGPDAAAIRDELTELVCNDLHGWVHTEEGDGLVWRREPFTSVVPLELKPGELGPLRFSPR